MREISHDLAKSIVELEKSAYQAGVNNSSLDDVKERRQAVIKLATKMYDKGRNEAFEDIKKEMGV
ncbi:hypothetical protein LB941_00945 [Ligilactobacillus sp. WILCCON 0076]|uniref:Uncharacterized protein n=1 Tax=Ligilactobacillus ubinensis TaxID=2876789 RepID=A0A9X2JKN2_9LACO|nr:hypothetical protein [Ligilactobacillus ubinensis]MCP0885900.1 hypothetical protein [Ligilactobacillus ubinensis]